MENQNNITTQVPNATYNKLAVIAFISSIVGGISFFVPIVIFRLVGPLLMFAAIIMGIIALVQIKDTNQKGRAFAILAIVGLILWPMIFGLMSGLLLSVIRG